MRISKFLAALLLCVLLTGLAIPAQASVADAPDPTQPVSLTIIYRDKETPLEGAAFSLYRVATMDEDGRFTPEAPFDKYNLTWSDPSEIAWTALATTLEGYILRDDIVPSDSWVTDEEGIVSFPTPNGKLEQGLYLVLGRRHTQDGYAYETSPFLIHLPTQSEESGEWVYHTELYPKHESTPDGSEEPLTRKVLKVWADDGFENQRPREIQVQLLRDGEPYGEPVTLSAENNWRHTWEELDADAHWTIVETEEKGYTVAVTQAGVTFIVTNTYSGVTPPPSPTPTPPPPNNPPPKIPQTGQLWWPIPILILAGMFLVISGLTRRKDG